MTFQIRNGREVNIGDTVTLVVSERWFSASHKYMAGDRMELVADTPDGDYYMNVNDEGLITLEVGGLYANGMDFE